MSEQVSYRRTSEGRILQTNTRRHRRQERKCTYCGQKFSKSEHLARHVRSHTKEKPFGCQACNKSYGRHDSLLRHIRTHSLPEGVSVASYIEVSQIPSPSISESAIIVACDNSPSNNSGHLGAHSPSRSLGVDHSRDSPSQVFDGGPRTALDGEGGAHTLLDYSNTGPDSASCVAQTISPQPAGGGQYVSSEVNFFDTPAEAGFWDMNLSSHQSLWLLGDGFDINALKDSVSASIPDWQQAHQDFPQSQSPDQFLQLSQDRSVLSRAGYHSTIQESWYTRISHDIASQDGPTRFDQEQVDEAYRANLSTRLRPHLSDDLLPSADFLNLCIKLYFARFNQFLALIHAPSFRPSSENALLLLSICSIGALFVGSAPAVVQGKKIYKRLNKAILTSWETSIRCGGQEALSMVQAATLGQTFGMLSGNASDLLMTECFHGTVIAWARRDGMFNGGDPLQLLGLGNSACVEDAWKRWIKAEETARIAIVLHIHDCELASIFHHEPLLRHSGNALPLCCSEEVFTAPTASQWQELVKDSMETSSGAAVRSSRPFQPYPHMHAYGSLATIIASVFEVKNSPIDLATAQKTRASLMDWFNDYFKPGAESTEDPHCLMVLWHEAFLYLYADFDLLERLIGRNGPDMAEDSLDAGRKWATTSEAQRCVLHALLIQRHMENPQTSMQPAIHVAKALFYSGMVIYCYVKYQPRREAATSLLDEGSCQEFQISEPRPRSSRRAWRARSLLFCSVDAGALCNAVDLLRRVGPWEISRKFASILEHLVDDLVNPFSNGSV